MKTERRFPELHLSHFLGSEIFPERLTFTVGNHLVQLGRFSSEKEYLVANLTYCLEFSGNNQTIYYQVRGGSYSHCITKFNNWSQKHIRIDEDGKVHVSPEF